MRPRRPVVSRSVKARAATTSDVQAAAVTLAGAFAADPVWGWAFPEPAQLEVWWRFWIQGALPAGLGADDRRTRSAVAVWIPPGGYECRAGRRSAHRAAAAGAHRRSRAAWCSRRSSASTRTTPHEIPHYYLSLLGTAPAHRGHGIGMALLADSLARIDEQHAPAYLESSNPVNLAALRGGRLRAAGRVQLPDGRTVITTMWRDPAECRCRVRSDAGLLEIERASSSVGDRRRRRWLRC